MYIMTCLSERVRKGAFQHLVTHDIPVKYIYLLMDMSVQARGCPRTQRSSEDNLWGQFSLRHISLSDVNSGGFAWYLYLPSRLDQTCMILFISKCGQVTRGSFGLDSRAKLQKQCELLWHRLETHLQAYFVCTNVNNNQFKATFLQ